MTKTIKSLLTRAQQTVLRKAAELLVADDEFDDYFFKLLAIRKGLDSTNTVIVPIGSNHAVVKMFDTGRKQCVEVTAL